MRFHYTGLWNVDRGYLTAWNFLDGGVLKFLFVQLSSAFR